MIGALKINTQSMPVGLFKFSQMDESIFQLRIVWLSLLLSCSSCSFVLRKITHLRFANSVDPDLTPLCAASDPGLHCFPTLPVSRLWNASNNGFKCKLL